jgi:hypothetical protein
VIPSFSRAVSWGRQIHPNCSSFISGSWGGRAATLLFFEEDFLAVGRFAEAAMVKPLEVPNS